ncbi:unnamed protein product [Urochloa humidicola]
MDRLGDRKRAREGEQEAPAAGKKRGMQAEEDAAVVALFEEAAATAAALTAADGAGGGEGSASWVRPAGVFDLPWQKCRNGLGGGGGGGGGWELRDVFFRSLVDGRAAAIGIPGDRLFPPPSKLTLFDDLEAWLAGAGDGEVDPLWRSVLEGPKPAA